jgi:hypothetical protein
MAESVWTGKARRSLNRIDAADAALIERLLREQDAGTRTFPYDEAWYKKLLTSQVRRADRDVVVTVPDEDELEEPATTPPAPSDTRESTRVQALLADIGARMGYRIWLPANDRAAVLRESKHAAAAMLDRLPFNYEEVTLRTVEQIDVLWVIGRSITRAFEVEHTTSIYSGILRMADLLALQPNMQIRLHIVAPEARRDHVFRQLQRPVFSFIEGRPLAEQCTYLAYESVREIADLNHLDRMSDGVLDDFAESAED